MLLNLRYMGEGIIGWGILTYAHMARQICLSPSLMPQGSSLTLLLLAERMLEERTHCTYKSGNVTEIPADGKIDKTNPAPQK